MARVEEFERRVAELKARLGLNSTHSSKPPSSDPPGTKRVAGKPTGRRPGGQPGHEHHERQLLPAEQVDRIVELPPPEQCEGCQRKLEGPWQEAQRHQQIEVPPLKPVVTEYRCQAAECAHCGRVNRAELPPEVAGQVFGERLSALVCLLVGKYRLSKRLVQQALSDRDFGHRKKWTRRPMVRPESNRIK